jgi:hypothetical protein
VAERRSANGLGQLVSQFDDRKPRIRQFDNSELGNSEFNRIIRQPRVASEQRE